jgi:hypothetical protein
VPETPKPLQHLLVEKATVVSLVPGRNKGVRRPAGVFDAQGKTLPLAQCSRDGSDRITLPPPAPVPKPDRHLSGTWLFGGMLYAHFGHFLCESTCRLWGLDLPFPVDGVIFHPKPIDGRTRRLLSPTLPWLRVAGVTTPVEAPIETLSVDRLLIPEQAFGTGPMVAGRPEYHAYMRRAFGKDIRPEGPERLYISRTALFSKRGRILGEAQIEALLRAEGYEVYHPQDHDIGHQIARYKAARQIISTDCSALHLAAFFAKPGDHIAILASRPGPTIQEFTAQYQAFAQITPLAINTITGLWATEGARLAQMSEVYASIDFATTARALAEGGFISQSAAWANPSDADLATERQNLSERLEAALHPVPLA